MFTACWTKAWLTGMLSRSILHCNVLFEAPFRIGHLKEQQTGLYFKKISSDNKWNGVRANHVPKAGKVWTKKVFLGEISSCLIQHHYRKGFTFFLITEKHNQGKKTVLRSIWMETIVKFKQFVKWQGCTMLSVGQFMTANAHAKGSFWIPISPSNFKI